MIHNKFEFLLNYLVFILSTGNNISSKIRRALEDISRKSGPSTFPGQSQRHGADNGRRFVTFVSVSADKNLCRIVSLYIDPIFFPSIIFQKFPYPCLTTNWAIFSSLYLCTNLSFGGSEAAGRGGAW